MPEDGCRTVEMEVVYFLGRAVVVASENSVYDYTLLFFCIYGERCTCMYGMARGCPTRVLGR